MKFTMEPKSDLSISDNQHLENTILSNFISFNAYKTRIQKQLDEVATKVVIDDETYYKYVNIKNKLGSSSNTEYSLLKNFGFSDETIQEIIDFNNDEDLDYLRLTWQYKMQATIDKFENKLDELNTLLQSKATLKIRISPTAPFGGYINILLDDIETNQYYQDMLYGLHASKVIGYSSKTQYEDPGNSIYDIIEYTNPYILQPNADELFLEYAGDSKVYKGKTYFIFRGTGGGTSYNWERTPYKYFWKGYRAQEQENIENLESTMFTVENVKWGWTINQPLLWSRKKMRTARQEVFFDELGKFITIDYEVDESWFERFVSFIVEALFQLVSTVVDLILKIPVLGTLLKLTLDVIGEIVGISDWKEMLAYYKQILFAILVIVIAYFTGQYQAIGEVATAGATASVSTYAMAAMEFISIANTVMYNINIAEARFMAEEEQKEKNERDNEVPETQYQSPENLNADPNAPDTEMDYMYEHMFTVPDWSIDVMEQQSDIEPQSKYIDI